MRRLILLAPLIAAVGCADLAEPLTATPGLNGLGIWVPWWVIAVVWLPISLILVFATYLALRARNWAARAVLTAMTSLLFIQGISVAMRVAADLEWLKDGGIRLQGEYTAEVGQFDWLVVILYGIGLVGLIWIALRSTSSSASTTTEEGFRPEHYVVDGRLPAEAVFSHLVSKVCRFYFCRADVSRMLGSVVYEKVGQFNYTSWRWLVHGMFNREKIQAELAQCYERFLNELNRVEKLHKVQASQLLAQVELMLKREPTAKDQEDRIAEFIRQSLK